MFLCLKFFSGPNLSVNKCSTFILDKLIQFDMKSQLWIPRDLRKRSNSVHKFHVHDMQCSTTSGKKVRQMFDDYDEMTKEWTTQFCRMTFPQFQRLSTACNPCTFVLWSSFRRKWVEIAINIASLNDDDFSSSSNIQVGPRSASDTTHVPLLEHKFPLSSGSTFWMWEIKSWVREEIRRFSFTKMMMTANAMWAQEIVWSRLLSVSSESMCHHVPPAGASVAHTSRVVSSVTRNWNLFIKVIFRAILWWHKASLIDSKHRVDWWGKRWE